MAFLRVKNGRCECTWLKMISSNGPEQPPLAPVRVNPHTGAYDIVIGMEFIVKQMNSDVSYGKMQISSHLDVKMMQKKRYMWI